MLAGILAATMSTVDSTINAICACLHSDIFLTRRKALSFYLKRDTLLVSFLLLVVAIIASKSSEILKLGLTIQSWTAGGMLAFFAVFLWLKKSPTSKQLLLILIAALSGVAFNTLVLKFSWHWNTYWGFGFGILVYLTYDHFYNLNKGRI